MASQNGAALSSGLRRELRPNDGLADRVRQAYEHTLREKLATVAADSALLGLQANDAQARQVRSIVEGGRARRSDARRLLRVRPE